MNGVVEFNETAFGVVNLQVVATYRCNTGFGLSDGDRVRTCVDSGWGGWTGAAPLCEGKKYTWLLWSSILYLHSYIERSFIGSYILFEFFLGAASLVVQETKTFTMLGEVGMANKSTKTTQTSVRMTQHNERTRLHDLCVH